MIGEKHVGYLTLLRLTLVTVLLFGPSTWYVAVPADAVAIALLVRADWLKSRVGWALLLLILAEGLVLLWYSADNHQYLLVYWVLAMNISLHQQRSADSLGVMARHLLAATFCFAVAWKLVDRGFLDGTFWEAVFLTDPRLPVGQQVLGGLAAEQVSHNQAALTAIADPARAIQSVALRSTETLQHVGVALGWFGLFIEASLAGAFLVPRSPFAYRAGVALIATFLVTAYFWLPVLGFGWLLGIMTIAQLPRSATMARGLLLWVLIGLMVARVPKEFLFAPMLS